MLLTDKYTDKIYGTITFYDSMVIRGYTPGWSHAEGMTGYRNANNIRIFDFSNFFAERDLHVLEVISRGEHMTFRMQGKDIRQHFENISPSAMSRIFKRLRFHGIIERVQGSYKYFATAYGKEIIAAGLTVRNLMLNQYWYRYFPYAEILPFCVKNH